MPAIYTTKADFLYYECDHLQCTESTNHPEPTRPPYAWCQAHEEERLSVSFAAIDAAYISERERLRTTYLAFYLDGSPRATYLGPAQDGVPFSAEQDIFILQAWKKSANDLYALIAR